MEIYLVGGAVRDALLGIPVKERDWVVVGSNPEEMRELGFKTVGTDFPVFLHPNTKEEYALARTERKKSKGHKGFIFHADKNVTLIEDLKRRDLRINAIAQSESGEIIDPYNGKKDIKNKVLRKVSDAFQEDPLRVLRVARFASKLKYLDFSIEKETLNTMKTISKSNELKTLSSERIWNETYKALKEKNPEEYFKVLTQSEAIYKIAKNFDMDLMVFKRISSEILEPELRWASLATNRDCNIDDLNKAFGVPRKIKDLSKVFERLIHFGFTQTSEEIDSRKILNLIEKVDGLRRNNRFIEAVKIYDVFNRYIFPQTDNFIPWINLSKLLLNLKPSSTKIKGKEIAKDLTNQRIKIINQIINTKDE